MGCLKAFGCHRAHSIREAAHEILDVFVDLATRTCNRCGSLFNIRDEPNREEAFGEARIEIHLLASQNYKPWPSLNTAASLIARASSREAHASNSSLVLLSATIRCGVGDHWVRRNGPSVRPAT